MTPSFFFKRESTAVAKLSGSSLSSGWVVEYPSCGFAIVGCGAGGCVAVYGTGWTMDTPEDTMSFYRIRVRHADAAQAAYSKGFKDGFETRSE